MCLKYALRSSPSKRVQDHATLSPSSQPCHSFAHVWIQGSCTPIVLTSSQGLLQVMGEDRLRDPLYSVNLSTSALKDC